LNKASAYVFIVEIVCHSWAFIASPYRSSIGSPSEIGLPIEDDINYDDRLGGWWVNPNYNLKRKT